MKCFEINLLLNDPIVKEFKDLRQYFHQPLGGFQAIQNTIAWVHLELKKRRENHPLIVVEKLGIWQWEIAIPEHTGEIKTVKIKDKVLNWSYEKGIIEIRNFSQGKRKQIYQLTRSLNKYRHVKSEVLIEEVFDSLI